MIKERSHGVRRTFGLLAVIWIVLLFYSNEYVLTPQVLANLSSQAGGMQMSPDQMDTLQRMEWLSYALIPLMLAVRVALTALVLQLFTMLLSEEVPYRNLFRAALWGFGAVLYGMFVQTLGLDLLGSNLTMAELGVVPDSLAALIAHPDGHRFDGLPGLEPLERPRSALDRHHFYVFSLRMPLHLASCSPRIPCRLDHDFTRTVGAAGVHCPDPGLKEESGPSGNPSSSQSPP